MPADDGRGRTSIAPPPRARLTAGLHGAQHPDSSRVIPRHGALAAIVASASEPVGKLRQRLALTMPRRFRRGETRAADWLGIPSESGLMAAGIASEFYSPPQYV